MSNLKIGGRNVGKIYLGDKLLLADGLKDLTGSMYIDSDNALFIIINRNDYDVKIKINDTEYNIKAKSFLTADNYGNSTVTITCLTETYLAYNTIGFEFADGNVRPYRSYNSFDKLYPNDLIASARSESMTLIMCDDNFNG